MLQTVIGIGIGVLATILVGHYYYRRSTRKSIRAFTLINTSVFGGLTPDLRDDLHVSFRSETVKDLLQIEILIINDGERSINNLIKPLTLSLSPEARILDASVLHRSTDSLEISIKTEPSTTEDTPARVLLNFPLLNKGEYFVLKLLLTGTVLVKELSFSLAADDLPRSFYAEWFQPENFDMLSPRNQLTAGLVILSIEAAIIAGLYYLHVLPVSGPERVNDFETPLIRI